MELIKKEAILQEIPLFSGLSSGQRNLIGERISFKEYKKNEIIYQEGAPADAFYIVVLGRVVIYTLDERANETLLEYLHRGKYFGIISLLTGEPHSVTAKAINDCLLLIIKKDDFYLILEKIPRLAIDLSQTLSRRLKRKDIHQKTIFESMTIALFSSYSQAGKTVYALNMALSLTKETRKSVIILDIAPGDKIHSLPRKLEIEGNYPVFDLSSSLDMDTARVIKDFILKDRFGINLIALCYKPEDELCVRRLQDVLSLLVNDYHYVILDLPSEMDRSIFDMLNQSDLIHILTSPESVDLKKTASLISRLKTELNFHEDKIKIVINEYKASRLTYAEQLELLGHPIFATLPRIEFKVSDTMVLDEPDSEYAKAVRRIARKIGDCLVGLALGVGVAYGFCHIGVLKVIEEEHIPIDIISGSSVGALIASLWVTGRSSGEILEITQEFKEPKYIWGLVDLTLPFLGFIKGNKFRRFLKKHLGSKTFYDVKLPLEIVASDVKRKEPVILDKGLLADAIMASCTMPGVFTPFRFKQSLLFDGGVISPLPTEPLFKMGAKKIIAVNVTPSREDIFKQYEKIKESGASAGNHYKNKLKTNILDIIFSSVEILQSEVAEKEGKLADIVLHPDTSGMYWLELHRAKEFAKRGEDEARKNLDKIWHVINE